MLIDRIERVSTALLSAAAIVVAGLAIHQQFVPAASAIRTDPPTYEPAWRDAVPVGVRLGDTTARNTMVVFSDLECPGCRQFHQSVRRLLRERPHDVSVVFVHFPLGMHRFANQAAEAAECAQAQGRFGPFVDAVFDQQDSIGMKSWGAFAASAGVSDTASINACARNPTPTNRMQAGRALGLRWGIHATPTVLINGRRYSTPPGEDEIDRALRAGPDAAAARPIARESSRLPNRQRVEVGDSDFVAHNVVRLFYADLPPSARRDSAAMLIIRHAFLAQFADVQGSEAEQFDAKRRINGSRDSALRQLLSDERQRAVFDRNVAGVEGTPARQR